MIIFLIILLIIILLLILPVSVSVSVTEKQLVTARYTFFKFTLYDSEKEEEPETPKKNKPKKGKTVKKKKASLKELFDLFKSLVPAFSKALKRILSGIKIKIKRLNISVATEDSAETAIKYGYYCAAIYPAISVLKSFFNLSTNPDKINITCDFTGEIIQKDISVKVSFKAITGLFALIGFGFAFLKVILKTKSKEKTSHKNPRMKAEKVNI